MLNFLQKTLVFSFSVVVFVVEMSAQAAHTRVTNPNAFSAEFGGRGLLYSVGFDRVLNDNLVAGIAYGSVSLNNSQGLSADLSASMLPMYVNYYLTQDAGSFFATVGVNLILNASNAAGYTASVNSLEFSSSPLMPTFGIGYEYRSDAGFLARLAAYGMVNKNFVPWGGISFGYSY